jgi:hypothetical protein
VRIAEKVEQVCAVGCVILGAAVALAGHSVFFWPLLGLMSLCGLVGCVAYVVREGGRS